MFGYAITHAEDAPKLSDATDIDGSPLGQVVHSDLAMLVSTGTPTTNEPVAFMRCVRAISDMATTIPLQAAADPIHERTAIATLRSGAVRFEQLLVRFSGAREWSLRIRAGASVRSDAHDQSPAGAAYLQQERLRLAQRDGIDEQAARTASIITPKLAALTREMRLLPSTDSAACLAMLVERDREDDLRAQADAIARELGDDASFNGPYPAFSFTSPG